MIEHQVQTTNSTSLSSSSSNNSSRRNSQERYPDLIHKHEKLEKKKSRGPTRHKSYSTDQVFESVTEAPLEKDEKEDNDNKPSLPHIQMINDFQEFSEKIQNRQARPRRRNVPPSAKSFRRRSYSPNNLPKVEEEAFIEDEDLRNKFVFKLGLMLDKNEFNQKVSRARRFSLKPDQFQSQPIIMEDLRENIKEQIPYQIPSPRYKLKVDELDLFEQNLEKKQQWNNSQSEVIEVIEEEKHEEEQNVIEKQMFNKSNFCQFLIILQKVNYLLTEDRDYLKRIIKGDQVIDEDMLRKHQMDISGEYEWKQMITEAEIQSNNGSDGSSDSQKE